MSIHVERGRTRVPHAIALFLFAVSGGMAAAQTPGHTINPTVLAPSARHALPHGGVVVDPTEPGQALPHPAHVSPDGNGHRRHVAPHHRHHTHHHHVKPFVEEWR